MSGLEFFRVIKIWFGSDAAHIMEPSCAFCVIFWVFTLAIYTTQLLVQFLRALKKRKKERVGANILEYFFVIGVGSKIGLEHVMRIDFTASSFRHKQMWRSASWISSISLEMWSPLRIQTVFHPWVCKWIVLSSYYEFFQERFCSHLWSGWRCRIYSPSFEHGRGFYSSPIKGYLLVLSHLCITLWVYHTLKTQRWWETFSSTKVRVELKFVSGWLKVL